MLIMVRGWTQLILQVTGQRWRSRWASLTNVGCAGMLRVALLYLHFQLNGILRNLTGSKAWTCSTKLMFFELIGKTRWPTWHLINWDSFDFSEPLNRIQQNLTGSKISTSSTKFVFFSGRLEKEDGQPGLWLTETFSNSSLKPLNGIQRYLTGIKISTSSAKFMFFGPIEKIRWPTWPLIGWDRPQVPDH